MNLNFRDLLAIFFVSALGSSTGYVALIVIALLAERM